MYSGNRLGWGVSMSAGRQELNRAGVFAPSDDRGALPCGPPDLESLRSGATFLGVGSLSVFVAVLAVLTVMHVIRTRRSPPRILRTNADGDHGAVVDADCFAGAKHGSAAGAERRRRAERWLLTVLAVLAVVGLLGRSVLTAAAVSMEPPPRPESGGQSAPPGLRVEDITFDALRVPAEGAVAVCSPMARHDLAGRMVGNIGDAELFIVSQVRPDNFYVQAALHVVAMGIGADGRWSTPVYVNEDGTYNRRPAWMMIVAARGNTAALLRRAATQGPGERTPMREQDWQVVAKIRVAKFPDGFAPFASWSAW